MIDDVNIGIEDLDGADIEFSETFSLGDDEIEDLAKDDPELHVEVDFGGPDRLDDSDDEVDTAPEVGKTGTVIPDEE